MIFFTFLFNNCKSFDAHKQKMLNYSCEKVICQFERNSCEVPIRDSKLYTVIEAA